MLRASAGGGPWATAQASAGQGHSSAVSGGTSGPGIRWRRWASLKAHRGAIADSAKPATQQNPALRVISHTGALVGPERLHELGESSSDDLVESEEEESLVTVVRGSAATRGHERQQTVGQGNTGRARLKKTNRLKLRALDFLSSIPMDAEENLTGVKDGVNDDTAVDATAAGGTGGPNADCESGLEKEDENDKYLNNVEERGVGAESTDARIGIRLRGNPNYLYVSSKTVVPMTTSSASSSTSLESIRRGTKKAPTVAAGSLEASKNKRLIAAGINDSSRVFMSWEKGYPGMTFSVIKYDEGAESERRKKMRRSLVMMEIPRRRNEAPRVLSEATWLKREGTSYAKYFNAEWAEACGDTVDPQAALQDEAWDREYLAEDLDDPRIRQGKHRNVQSLDGYYVSVLPYTKKKDLKAELNEVFREQHPALPADLTLSKIRNLKAEVLQHVAYVGLELSTAALAIVYFEKLVFKGVVYKSNRKLVMSVCLVLAFKFNEPKRETVTLKNLLEDIERVQSLSPKQVLKAEFAVLGHLLFKLNPDREHFLPHFYRLLKTVEQTPTSYLGQDLAEFYFSQIMREESNSVVGSSSEPSDGEHHSPSFSSLHAHSKRHREKNRDRELERVADHRRHREKHRDREQERDAEHRRYRKARNANSDRKKRKHRKKKELKDRKAERS